MDVVVDKATVMKLTVTKKAVAFFENGDMSTSGLLTNCETVGIFNSLLIICS